MSLTDERKKIEKNKEDLKAARTAINNKLVELGGTASASFNDIPEKTTELANTITATNKEYIDSKTGDLTNLQTQDKTNLVNAINEILNGSEINATDVSFNDTETQLGASNLQIALVNIVNQIKALKTELNGEATRLSSINSEFDAIIGIPTPTSKSTQKSINSKLKTLSTSIDTLAANKNAIDIKYDDSITQLGASNVQDAINAIVSDLKLIKTDLEGQAARLASINTLLEAEIGAPQVIQ